jgi:hypothetical protein
MILVLTIRVFFMAGSYVRFGVSDIRNKCTKSPITTQGGDTLTRPRVAGYNDISNNLCQA